MSGISGFFNPFTDYTREEVFRKRILENMNRVQKHRGPDAEGLWLSPLCGLSHVLLNITGIPANSQPIQRTCCRRVCTIVYDGTLYNAPELKAELILENVSFQSDCDAEIILAGFMLHGKDYIQKLNGIFSIALWDDTAKELHLFRDRLGVKPLFYTVQENTLVFASEIKGLFAYPDITPTIDRSGLCEILALGPAKTYGKGVFKDILEVLPGEHIQFTRSSCQKEFYWKLNALPHSDSFEDTIEKTRWLLTDSIRRRMRSDVPVCTFLSGGIDSSFVTAVCANEQKKQGLPLDTFSFDFTDNDKYFQSSTFQPSQDRPFAEQMISSFNTSHRFLECSNQDQLNCLYKAVDARDLPCMADVESSMLYFCSQVKKFNTVALTGECADEIFGGYPWFHKKEALEADTFPWSQDMNPRQALLDDSLIQELHMEDYSRAAYKKTLQETPLLSEDSPFEQRQREITYLNLRWFMSTLLDRMERTSMYNSLEARVPFADYRIVEYIYNVPWSMKCPDGIVKGLLRFAGEGLLPKEILWRRKSPYPKTYDPHYEASLHAQLKEVLASPNAPVRAILDTHKVHHFLDSPSDYGKPWYGQLMAGPQMLAYMLQINYWMETYHIHIIE